MSEWVTESGHSRDQPSLLTLRSRMPPEGIYVLSIMKQCWLNEYRGEFWMRVWIWSRIILSSFTSQWFGTGLQQRFMQMLAVPENMHSSTFVLVWSAQLLCVLHILNLVFCSASRSWFFEKTQWSWTVKHAVIGATNLYNLIVQHTPLFLQLSSGMWFVMRRTDVGKRPRGG